MSDDPASVDWLTEMIANSRDVTCPVCGQKERVFGKQEADDDATECWVCLRDRVGDE